MKLALNWKRAEDEAIILGECPRPLISLVSAHTIQILLILIFLYRLYSDLIPENIRDLIKPHLPNYVIVWDNLNFHHSLVRYSKDGHGLPTTLLSFHQSYLKVFLHFGTLGVYEHQVQTQSSI